MPDLGFDFGVYLVVATCSVVAVGCLGYILFSQKKVWLPPNLDDVLEKHTFHKD